MRWHGRAVRTKYSANSGFDPLFLLYLRSVDANSPTIVYGCLPNWFPEPSLTMGSSSWKRQVSQRTHGSLGLVASKRLRLENHI
jgi:hypothetical protein